MCQAVGKESHIQFIRNTHNVTKGDAKEGVNVNVCDHPRTTYYCIFFTERFIGTFFFVRLTLLINLFLIGGLFFCVLCGF